MKGHIRKRTGPHGVSYAVVVYAGKDPGTGRDRYKWSGGHKTKRAAELALPEYTPPKRFPIIRSSS